ncbi:MAG: cytochrome P450 [Gammaproteobacteria bacterium]|nr:cytochrome P450 [Gammaproteobacteria bacterium]
MSEAVQSPVYEPVQDPWSVPLDKVDPAFRRLFEENVVLEHFARLRREDPVHFHEDSQFGPYWSITSYEHIKQVDMNHQVYSSAKGISIFDGADDFRTPMFIAMDPPKHDEQRKAVAPVAGPRNLAALEPEIRRRVCNILDSLPVGEEFNWVERVSIELTTQMLATLFDFPFEERYKLTRWSDVATNGPETGVVESIEQRREELLECLARFTELWEERAARPEPGNDLISMLAHGPSTRDMLQRPMELLGNLILLIVGGNDTTRNSISGGVLALNQQPEQYQKLRDNVDLIPNMVAEIIRWQTPLTHMRRTTVEDTELGGKTIPAGAKVVMWYLSGNRDENVFDDADAFRIDRKNARSHMSFGFGIHRCMGNRVGEMQLRILWEEIMKRFAKIEVVGEPVRTRHVFIRGFTHLPVRLVPR